MSRPSIGVVIPTLNAARDLVMCLKYVVNNLLVDRVLIVDSESTDGTVELAQQLGAETLSIRRYEFNHATTRELGRKILGTDIVIYLTQDAYLQDDRALAKLVNPIVTGVAEVSYGRQIPRVGSDVFEALPRLFNYPSASAVRTIGDAAVLGVLTFFCSNSFAAYKQTALDEIGGFEFGLTNEDYFAVARILAGGGAISYVADAEVEHSHRYTLLQEFKRYFDTGYVRAQHPWVQTMVGPAESRGAKLAFALLSCTARRPWLIPYAVGHLFAKWCGYRIGFFSSNGPTWLKRSLSSQPYFWSPTYVGRVLQATAKGTYPSSSVRGTVFSPATIKPPHAGEK